MGWRVLIKNTEIMHEKSTFILKQDKTYMDTLMKSRLVWKRQYRKEQQSYTNGNKNFRNIHILLAQMMTKHIMFPT